VVAFLLYEPNSAMEGGSKGGYKEFWEET